jgi:hypothetical protein
MVESDKLLYEKANTYRLHADNLRWTLLGGYGAFFAAVMLQLKDTGLQPNPQTALLFLILFSISLFYLFILAVQSWYYNLFGAYVEDCEERLVSGQKLESLATFTESAKATITPLHFGFSFALYIVAFTSLGFLIPVFQYIFFSLQIDIAQNLFRILGFAILGFVLYIAIFRLIFRNWNKLAFPLISALSGDESRKKQKRQAT